MPEVTTALAVLYCPRCDRPFSGPGNSDKIMERIIDHVSRQHPDHDSLWYETYPEAFGN